MVEHRPRALGSPGLAGGDACADLTLVRILEVTEASAAGTLRIVETLCSGLTRAGHEVTFAHGRRPESPATIGGTSDEQYEIARLDWDRRTVATQVRARRQLGALVRRVRPDVIHLHSAFAGLVGGSLGHTYPRVYTPHGWASTFRDWRFQRVLGAALDRFVIQRCDLVGVASDSEAAVARRLGPDRLIVVPNGIPELDALLQPGPGQPGPPRPGSRPLVVAGGRLVASRRPVESARILSGVQDRADTRWIGDGPQAAVDAVRSLGVEVTGWLAHAEAMDQVGSATAYVHWTSCDGQSVALLEAMARDVAVIASDIAPNRELLDAEQLFSREADAIEMLHRVLDSPALRTHLTDRQRVRAASHGAARMVDRWSGAYERAISAHATRLSA